MMNTARHFTIIAVCAPVFFQGCGGENNAEQAQNSKTERSEIHESQETTQTTSELIDSYLENRKKKIDQTLAQFPERDVNLYRRAKQWYNEETDFGRALDYDPFIDEKIFPAVAKEFGVSEQEARAIYMRIDQALEGI